MIIVNNGSANTSGVPTVADVIESMSRAAGIQDDVARIMALPAREWWAAVSGRVNGTPVLGDAS